MAKITIVASPTYKTKEKYKKFFQPKSYIRSSSFSWRTVSDLPFRVNLFYKPKPSFSNFAFFLLYKRRRVVFRISLKTASGFFIKTSTFNGIKRLIAPFFRGKKMKKQSKLNVNVFTTFNFTKKPLAVRIGGGVGKKIRFSGLFVNKGFELLTVYTTKPAPLFQRLKKLKKKFSGRIVVSIS